MDVSVKEFMARVVPWPTPDGPGFINLEWKPSDGGWRGTPVKGVDEFLATAEIVAERETRPEIYFCLSQQLEIGRRGGHLVAKRSGKAAAHLKAIWLDIDVKEKSEKGYPTLEELLEALTAFVLHCKLPAPSAIVSSGGGVHVYWISDRPLTPEEWKPYAVGLKTAALSYGLKCDAGVTADAARVLRVPGTKNFKLTNARPVRLIGMRRTDYDFAAKLTQLATLREVPPSQARTNGAGGHPYFDPALFPKLAPIKDSLSAGIEKSDLPPLPLEPIKAGCAFIRTALETGGKDYSQPLWNLTTLCTTFMENGYELAHHMGNHHPEYSRGTTDAIWERKIRERHDKGLGWPSCRSIHDAGCGSCSSCPHFEKGKSPLNLALPELSGKGEIVTGPVLPANPPELHLPEGYGLNEEGFICKIDVVRKKDHPAQRVFHQLFYCRLFNPDSQKHPDALLFDAEVDKGHIRRVCLSASEIPGTTLCRALMESGCVKYVPDNKRFLEGFFMGWLAKVHLLKEAQEANNFGWWWDKAGDRRGFIYGNRIWKDDGTDIPAAITDPKIAAMYTPRGKKEPWLEACKLITNQKRPELEILVAASFAAPLMTFAGASVYNGIVSVWGETGATKTTANELALTVWGHPKLSKGSTSTTTNSAMGQLGKIRNLPFIWDDITDDKQRQHLLGVVDVGTQGVEKGRMDSRLNQNTKGEWHTLMVACANGSFVEYVVRERPASAAAQVRVLEFHVSPNPAQTGYIDDTDAGRKLSLLSQNFGMMGLEYAQILAREHKEIDKLTEHTIKAFGEKVKAIPEERYWKAMCGVLLAGATLANRLGATFDVPAMEEFLVQTFQDNRDSRNKEGAGKPGKDAEGALTEFLKYYIGNNCAIWTDTMPFGAGKPTLVNVLFAPSLESRYTIQVQFIRDDRLLRFSKREFRHFMAIRKTPTRSIMDGLKQFFHANQITRQLAAGTPYVCLQEDLIEIPVPLGSQLEQLMLAHGRKLETQ